MYLFWRELEIGGKSKILMVCLWGGFFEGFFVFQIFVPLHKKILHKQVLFKTSQVFVLLIMKSFVFFNIFECISFYYEGLFLFLKFVYFVGLYFWGLLVFEVCLDF